MRLIFLDIDGVIATDRTYKAWRAAKCPDTFEAYVGLIDPNLVADINQFAIDVGAGIVVSSSWRHDDVCPHPVDDVLRAAGFTVPIVDHTPVLGVPVEWRYKLKHRGYEINAYVVEHNLSLDSFVVFDDDMGATGCPIDTPIRHGSRVIFTPESTGVSPGHIRRARKLFGLPYVQVAADPA